MAAAEAWSFEDDIRAGVETAYIDALAPSNSSSRPLFISNDYRRGRKVAAEIETELKHCAAFDFSVAFITQGGIESLLLTLKDLERRGVPGRIMTTDYLSFSEPKALEKLASLKNIELRMYVTSDSGVREGFHTKGYLFTYENGMRKALIGSSNLTASALAVNKEWNLSFSSTEQGEAFQNVAQEFESLWVKAKPLDQVIDAYRAIHVEKRRMLREQPVSTYEQAILQPNAMQAEFVASLDNSIAEGADKALLISATGTGKTYASAFALRHINPRRALFLVHREQVLRKSIQSYLRVFGATKSCGLVSGSSRELDADYVFATVQTFSRSSFLNQIDPTEFDVVVIDEVHRAGADSYQKIMSYLKPQLFLGMTASPDRMDGFDIYGLFDNNIVHEIRLQQALEEDLLCPFHYFGITDISIDGEAVDELTDFSSLVTDERVDHILEQAEYYGYSGDRVKGLAFCRTNEEAQVLSRAFNARGYRTLALSGKSSQDERERAAARLAADDESVAEGVLDYLFTVDIFNEGVDIPEVNQVLMLRPTQSPIIFVQQLGRGLRKAHDKEFVVVLDFIGNYGNNYLIPIALSGDRTYNKDNVRKYVREGDRVIPGQSSIHFDEVSQGRIFSSIDQSKTGVKFLRQKYAELKHKLGRVPRMVDFQRFGEIDPLLIVGNKNYRSYYRFLAKHEPDFALQLSEQEHLVLEFLSQYLANGMRLYELQIVRDLLSGSACSADKAERELVEYGAYGEFDSAAYDSAAHVLSKEFVKNPNERKRYAEVEIVTLDDDSLVSSSEFAEMLSREDFRCAVEDVVDFGFKRYDDQYAQAIRLHPEYGAFALYEKYSRKDVCRLLNWPEDTSSTVYGYRVRRGSCPIFVTYNKAEDISVTTQYAEGFVDPSLFSWMTRSPRKLSSSEENAIAHAAETGLRILLFVKKSDDEGDDFYFLGEVNPVSWVETTTNDACGKQLPIVNFQLALRTSVQEDLYAYLVG